MYITFMYMYKCVKRENIINIDTQKVDLNKYFHIIEFSIGNCQGPYMYH